MHSKCERGEGRGERGERRGERGEGKHSSLFVPCFVVVVSNSILNHGDETICSSCNNLRERRLQLGRLSSVSTFEREPAAGLLHDVTSGT